MKENGNHNPYQWAWFVKQCALYVRVNRKLRLTVKGIITKLFMGVAMLAVALMLYAIHRYPVVVFLLVVGGIGYMLYTLESARRNQDGRRQLKRNEIETTMFKAASRCLAPLDPQYRLVVRSIFPSERKAELAFKDGERPVELPLCDLYLIGSKRYKIVLDAPSEQLKQAALEVIHRKMPELYNSVTLAEA